MNPSLPPKVFEQDLVPAVGSLGAGRQRRRRFATLDTPGARHGPDHRPDRRRDPVHQPALVGEDADEEGGFRQRDRAAVSRAQKREVLARRRGVVPEERLEARQLGDEQRHGQNQIDRRIELDRNVMREVDEDDIADDRQQHAGAQQIGSAEEEQEGAGDL